MDADLLLGPDPFVGDPDALARWMVECVAIERAVRAALQHGPVRAAADAHPSPAPSRGLESGVYPAFGGSAELDADDTFDGLL